MEHTLPLLLQWDENFGVGADTGTPVDDTLALARLHAAGAGPVLG
jgi:hypothetical protein